MSAHPYATMFAGMTAGYFVAMYMERTTYKVPAPPKRTRVDASDRLPFTGPHTLTSQDEFVRDSRHKAKTTTGAVMGLPTAK